MPIDPPSKSRAARRMEAEHEQQYSGVAYGEATDKMLAGMDAVPKAKRAMAQAGKVKVPKAGSNFNLPRR